MIECALGDGSDFGPDCLIERSEVDGQMLLTVRHPDGGFRRFEQLQDGTGIVEADGADVVQRELDGEILEVAIGEDRYRFSVALQGGDDRSE